MTSTTGPANSILLRERKIGCDKTKTTNVLRKREFVKIQIQISLIGTGCQHTVNNYESSHADYLKM